MEKRFLAEIFLVIVRRWRNSRSLLNKKENGAKYKNEDKEKQNGFGLIGETLESVVEVKLQGPEFKSKTRRCGCKSIYFMPYSIRAEAFFV